MHNKLWIAAALAACCTAANAVTWDLTYDTTAPGPDPQPLSSVLTVHLSGNDSNGDGVLSADELTTLTIDGRFDAFAPPVVNKFGQLSGPAINAFSFNESTHDVVANVSASEGDPETALIWFQGEQFNSFTYENPAQPTQWMDPVLVSAIDPPDNPAPVPEPASAWLLLLGLMPLAARRRLGSTA